MSQDGQQVITIHILSIISRGKRNQTMKFCQLAEYNMRNIFLVEKLWRKNVVEKLVPALFIKNQNWVYLWINSPKFLPKYIKTKVLTTCF